MDFQYMLHGFKADRVMVSVSIEVNKTQDLTAMKSSTRSYLNYKKKLRPGLGEFHGYHGWVRHHAVDGLSYPPLLVPPSDGGLGRVILRLPIRRLVRGNPWKPSLPYHFNTVVNVMTQH